MPGVTKPNVSGNVKYYNIITLALFLTKLAVSSKIHFPATLVHWHWWWYSPFVLPSFPSPCQGKVDRPAPTGAALAVQTNQTSKTSHMSIQPVLWNHHSISRLTDWKNSITNCWMQVYPELLILSCLTGAALILHSQACIGTGSILLPSWKTAPSSVFRPKIRAGMFIEHLCCSYIQIDKSIFFS